MLQKTVKTTTGKISISLPDTISEVTLAQIMAMQETEGLTDLGAIHILSGVPLTELHNVKNMSDLQIFTPHVIALSKQIKELYNSNSIPKHVIFNYNGITKKINVITNLSVEPAGAFWAARDVITDEINDHIKKHGEEDWKDNFNPSLYSCALLLAHYFYCPVTGNWYNEHEAEQFIDTVKQLPFIDALPVAKCFFLSYPNLSKPRINFWERLQLLWKKRLELKAFRSLDMLIQLTP